ncbi:MAG: hypothetical protein AB3N64_02025 [Puniceicoccaceae bacterium]
MQGRHRLGPSPIGTAAILVCCVLGTIISFRDAMPSQVARWVSVVLLIGFAISFLLDARAGLRNLIRVDIFALLSFHFLLYFEFLFEQSLFDTLVIPDDLVTAIHLTLMGVATIVIGRHIDIFPKGTLDHIGKIEMRPRDFLIIFFGATFLNFLPMLLAVEFNPIAWFEETLKWRFGRAWGRGRYGDLSALLFELQLMGYVMPPVAGVILARRKLYSKFAVAVVLFFVVVLWYSAFSSGTRNVLAIQVAGFFAGFFIVQKQLKLKLIIPTVLLVGIGFVYLAGMMLEFRNMGLGRYIEEGRHTAAFAEIEDQYQGDNLNSGEYGYFVDYNLWRVAQMSAAFPQYYDYLGFNFVFVALTKPIPRAFWPGKPTDLAVSIEDVVGAQGYTVAVAWVGEAYIAGGRPWIIAIGLLIGMFCCYWNHLAKYITTPFPLIVFASGFYAILLLMRSLQFFTTSLLPSVALVVMGIVIHKSRGEN